MVGVHDNSKSNKRRYEYRRENKYQKIQWIWQMITKQHLQQRNMENMLENVNLNSEQSMKRMFRKLLRVSRRKARLWHP